MQGKANDLFGAAHVHYRGLRSLARRRLRNPDHADDVAQDVLLLFHRRKTPFLSDDHLRAWLFRACRHRILQYNRDAFDSASRVDIEDMELSSRLPAGAGTVGVLQGLLAQLPSKQREAIALRYFAGLTVHEIAKLTAAPPGTVESRLKRGLKKIRDGGPISS